MKLQPSSTALDWQALMIVIIMIIVARESCVWLMTQFGHPELGNLCGLVLLLLFLIVLRRYAQIPSRWINANAIIMREGALAFLPISAGAILMLVSMGSDIFAFLSIMTISTLLPLWGYAVLAKRWLK